MRASSSRRQRGGSTPQPPQRAALGGAAPQRVVQDVAARSPTSRRRPRRRRRVAAEAAAQLERPGVRLADEVDRELRVVRAAREPDEQAPRVALVGGGEVLLVEEGTGRATIFARPSSCDAARYQPARPRRSGSSRRCRRSAVAVRVLAPGTAGGSPRRSRTVRRGGDLGRDRAVAGRRSAAW